MTNNFPTTPAPSNGNFALQLRKDYIEQKRAILIAVGAFFGMAALLGTFIGMCDESSGIANSLYIFVSGIAACIFASLMFSPLKTKTGAIAMLMTPSSMKSKFMVRWIAVVPAMIVAIFIGAFVTELMRVVFSLLYGHHTSFVFPFFYLSTLFREVSFQGAFYIITLTIGSYLFTQGLYIVGAVLWPKLSFIKTLLAIWVIQTALQIIAVPLLPYLSKFFFTISPEPGCLFSKVGIASFPRLEAAMWAANILLWILTVGCWFVSYHLFTKVNINRFSSR